MKTLDLAMFRGTYDSEHCGLCVCVGRASHVCVGLVGS